MAGYVARSTTMIISTIPEEMEIRDVIAVSNFIIANILLPSDLDLSLNVRLVVSVGVNAI